MFRWFVFYNDRLLVQFSDGAWHVPCCEGEPVKVPVGSTQHCIGVVNGLECRTFSLLTPVPDSEAQQMVQLRASYDILSLQEYNMAGKAFEILNWDRNYRYCPACGVPLKQISAIGKKCPECRQEFYPNLAPAIIVRVQRDDKILMVRAKNFRGDFYGLVAGFVEPGETLEQCVEREVMEETGLHIANIRYFGSQPWPYPSGIMIGFTADYAGGELRLQEEELMSGGFFGRDAMPKIPKKLSIARRLIDDWLE